MNTPSHRFSRIGIVVPAHNEEQLLPGCLAALRSAAAAVEVPVHILVVLDACTDRSVDSVGRTEATLTVGERNVGAARRAGFAHLLHRHGVERLWLATTDADSHTPQQWLVDQLRHARDGIDAVAGMVTVADWSEHPTRTAQLFRTLHRPILGHPHVHGANLGMSARAYLAAGGFPQLAAHEDVALINALKHTGHRVLHTADSPVTTSARRRARATAGFADFLAVLAHPQADTA